MGIATNRSLSFAPLLRSSGPVGGFFFFSASVSDCAVCPGFSHVGLRELFLGLILGEESALWLFLLAEAGFRLNGVISGPIGVLRF